MEIILQIKNKQIKELTDKLAIDLNALIDYLLGELPSFNNTTPALNSLAYRVAFTSVYLDDLVLTENDKLTIYDTLVDYLHELNKLVLESKIDVAKYVVSVVNITNNYLVVKHLMHEVSDANTKTTYPVRQVTSS